MTEFDLPVPPQDVHCPKCGKDVVVAVNPGKPGIESDCHDAGCPIAADPNNQPTGVDGTLICFAEEDEN